MIGGGGGELLKPLIGGGSGGGEKLFKDVKLVLLTTVFKPLKIWLGDRILFDISFISFLFSFELPSFTFKFKNYL